MEPCPLCNIPFPYMELEQHAGSCTGLEVKPASHWTLSSKKNTCIDLIDSCNTLFKDSSVQSQCPVCGIQMEVSAAKDHAEKCAEEYYDN